VRTADVVAMIERRLSPDQSAADIRSKYHTFNSFSACLCIRTFTTIDKQGGLFIYVAVRVFVDTIGDQLSLPCKSAFATATVEMPAALPCGLAPLHSFNQVLQRTTQGAEEVRFYYKNMILGEDAVKDAATLLAALATHEQSVTSQDVCPVPEVAVAANPELRFRCTINSCE
jgi:hypothetical protein